MFNPGQWTVGDISSVIKDYGIFGTVLLLGWKARGLVQSGKDLVNKINGFIDKADSRFERADRHMATMESSMSTLLNNHLSHLKSDTEEKSEL